MGFQNLIAPSNYANLSHWFDSARAQTPSPFQLFVVGVLLSRILLFKDPLYLSTAKKNEALFQDGVLSVFAFKVNPFRLVSHNVNCDVSR